jgi:hypothetical protein
VLEKIGGCTRARTWDPLIKSQLLYQLSYTPHARPIGPVVEPLKAPQDTGGGGIGRDRPGI